MEKTLARVGGKGNSVYYLGFEMTEDTLSTVDIGRSGLTPWKIIQTYEPEEWQEFIVEWCEGFEPAYHQVVKLGGPGDKGRDVIGYLGDPQSDCE